MNIAVTTATIAGKVCYLSLRRFGSGGAALPGLISQKISPSLLHQFSRQCQDGVILICGTNGKTTISRMLSAMLEQEARPFIHNRSGSNLTRGHIAAFLEQASWQGKIAADLAILEVDEAVLPETLRQTKPRIVLLHNLFRDQLDRYGEVNSIRQKWLPALKKYLSPDSILLVNADDPNLAFLALELGHPRTILYGLNDPPVGTKQPTAALDAYLSPNGIPLHYSTYYLSHLGHYQGQPSLDIEAQHINLSAGDFSSDFQLKWKGGLEHYKIGIPGLYNVYNALAACSIALQLNLNPVSLKSGLAHFKSVFGRFERVQLKEKEIIFCLIKNPAGATEVLRTLKEEKEPFQLALFANDQFADGLDVSWYWDTPFELVSSRLDSLLCSGSRAYDMALRLKYADYDKAQIWPEPESAFDTLLNSAKGSKQYILSTYTATLQLQKILARHHFKLDYWKE